MSSVNTTTVEGDVSVTRNAVIGGDARVNGEMTVDGNINVGGYLKVNGMNFPAQGVFDDAENLPENPEDGWMAGVMVDDSDPNNPLGYKVKLYLAKDGWNDTDKYLNMEVHVDMTTDDIDHQAVVVLQQQVALKANSADVYSKTAVDDLIDPVSDTADAAEDMAALALALPSGRFNEIVNEGPIDNDKLATPIADEELVNNIFFYDDGDHKMFVCYHNEVYYTQWNDGGEAAYNYKVDGVTRPRPNKLYVDGSGVVYYVNSNFELEAVVVSQGQVTGLTAALGAKADKSEMSVTNGTGANADKVTIQLKSGMSAVALRSHQSLANYYTKADVQAMLFGTTAVKIKTTSLTSGTDYILCDDSALMGILVGGMGQTSGAYTPAVNGAIVAYVYFEDNESVPDGAFEDNTILTEVTLPETTNLLKDMAFAGCSNLSNVTCLAAEPPAWDEKPFGELTLGSMTLYVPADSVDAYDAMEDTWHKFGTIEGI